METTILILVVVGFMFIVAFILAAPGWLMLLGFLPIFAYTFTRTDVAYRPIYLIIIIPLLVADIQIVDDNVKPNIAGQIIPWLPGAVLFALFAINFSRMHFYDSLAGNIWMFVVGGFFITLMGKLCLGSPLSLLINRLKINRVEEVTYRISKLEAKKRSRAISYYLMCNDSASIEVSGFVFAYARLKGLENGGTATLKYKTGCLGICFATGFPKITVSSK